MMSTDRFDRELGIALGDLADPQVPDYLTDILGQTADLRQRPAWASIERWLPMEITTRPILRPSLPWRQLALVAALIALVVAAVAFYAGTHQTRLPAPFGPAANGLIPFVSNDDIYLGDPATGQTRQLTSGPGLDSGVITSPDGTKVSFVRDVPGSLKADVYVMDIDGSDLRKITATPIDQLFWGGFTADGRHLLLIHEVGAPVGSCTGDGCVTRAVDLVDTDGSGRAETILTARGITYVQSRPPDGQELLYRAVVDGKWGLFSMDLHGGNVRSIVAATVPIDMDATFGTASFSPDGRRVFFNMYTSDASGGDPGCCQLFAVDAAGGQPYKFVQSGNLVWDGEPTVSPDGRWIAFWHNLPDQPTQRVAVVAADGSGDVILTGPALAGGAHWVWSPDSTKILMFRNDTDADKGYLLDPAGGPETRLPWTSAGELDWQRIAPPS
jgi:Tol biopolymer transport system component